MIDPPRGTTSRDENASGLEGFYFLVGRRDPTFYGFVWRVWAGGSSFYIKPQYRGLAGFKVSLHGPDPRPGLSPGFKLDSDHSAPSPEHQAVTPGFLPCWFPGRLVGHGLTHVVRIAVPADTFSHRSVRYGPQARNPRGRMGAGFIDPPNFGSFASLDLYLSDQRPTWPGRINAERDNAIAGELRNSADQYLVGLTTHHELAEEPMPELLREFDAGPDESEITRGVAAAVDGRGFVWLCERLMSQSALRAG